MFEPLSGADGARIVPASGNLGVAGKQFWLGPDRAGVTVTFWADSQVIHLLIAAPGSSRYARTCPPTTWNCSPPVAAVPPPRPPSPPTDPDNGAAEVDRTGTASGLVSLAGGQVLAAEILAGRRRVTI